MSTVRDFCVECHGNFGILDRSETHPNTCTECIVKLRPSFLSECNDCRKVIQIGEKCHLGWVLLCAACAKSLNRQNGETIYRCETTASAPLG